MSTATKVAAGVCLALVLALGAESYIIHNQTSKLAAQTVQMQQLNEKIVQANKSVKIQDAVSKVTDAAVVATTTKITTNTQKGLSIKAQVDNVAKKVTNENLSITVANTVYVNSMWDAYCTANPSDSACSARQPTN